MDGCEECDGNGCPDCAEIGNECLTCGGTRECPACGESGG